MVLGFSEELNRFLLQVTFSVLFGLWFEHNGPLNGSDVPAVPGAPRADPDPPGPANLRSARLPEPGVEAGRSGESGTRKSS